MNSEGGVSFLNIFVTLKVHHVWWLEWSTHARPRPKHHDVILSVTHFLTFLTFSKNRQRRLDLLNTSVTRIPIVTVGLRDLCIIIIGRHTWQWCAHNSHRKPRTVAPGADWALTAIPKWDFLLPLGPFGDYTYKTRRWSRSIIHEHYAKQWSRVLGDISLKLTTEAYIIPLGIYFKVRKRGC